MKETTSKATIIPPLIWLLAVNISDVIFTYKMFIYLGGNGKLFRLPG